MILDFWADWCGPCRNDLPRLCQLHDDRRKNGLIIIGVHVSGSELPSVKQAISELHLAYPICIDIPQRRAPDKSEEGSFPSEFVSQFAIDSIPHFVVVNRRGIVAASLPNRFQDALAIAEGLAKAQDYYPEREIVNHLLVCCVLSLWMQQMPEDCRLMLRRT